MANSPNLLLIHTSGNGVLHQVSFFTRPKKEETSSTAPDDLINLVVRCAPQQLHIGLEFGMEQI